MRDFNEWLSKFKESIASWDYYVDFPKVYKNLSKIKDELNLLNGLVGCEDIKNEFVRITTKYPDTLKVIPILLAKRESEIKFTTIDGILILDFKKMNHSIELYLEMMEKSGLFELISRRIISNLYDYCIGVEVGMDTNARKNRTGKAMESIVEDYLKNSGFQKDVDYFTQVKKSMIEEKLNITLPEITDEGGKVNKKAEKRFDFVVYKNDIAYIIETNFYASSGSKLNETARSYKMLSIESKLEPKYKFIWITDGIGWRSAKNNLQETFDVLEDLYSIDDLEKGIFNKIFK